MSIVINGMDMPKGNSTKNLLIYSDGRVFTGHKDDVNYFAEEQTWIEIYEEQENLPSFGADVLLCAINGSMVVGYLTKDEEGLKWKVGTWYNDFLEWDAWRYLPEVWKG